MPRKDQSQNNRQEQQQFPTNQNNTASTPRAPPHHHSQQMRSTTTTHENNTTPPPQEQPRGNYSPSTHQNTPHSQYQPINYNTGNTGSMTQYHSTNNMYADFSHDQQFPYYHQQQPPYYPQQPQYPNNNRPRKQTPKKN